MPLGVHTSIEGGISSVLVTAKRLGCETVQFFGHSPRNWHMATLPQEEVNRFKIYKRTSGINPIILHTSYLINLSSPDGGVYKKSIRLFLHEIDIALSLSVDFVVTHLGSTLGRDTSFGINRVIKALSYVFDKRPHLKTGILLENTAGGGWTLGHRLNDIKAIIHALKGQAVGLCFDTCHGFAAGYPLHSPEDVDKLVKLIDNEVGLQNLRLIHLNDSKGGFRSRLDRHQHIGKGSIGLKGFKALVNHPQLKDIPMILETPKKSIRDDLRNLKIVRGMIL
ncbi:MAG: hypothetical protein A2022_01440 [Deltaproteobacteria bacterium GWF2_42_12]|nr:MAG: hypothetical protein A2090_08295 [Deltaproteobacteria bacterium GWD2_42_10]OGP48819.1 MAG: hypothetical protein A2022_01440 [Deltaproteobacteria bacterium GWF2_42_12]OGQ24853.1 MAG: hypothetical protein A3D29_00260 [Deltaproteobacteria bacterium RIFCSPHIGHO2_02_FULL_42_44]OGQ68294.1 MAG: hypothetical protein A3F88_00120 [Deltaproteobacteria bacterium RIFCSPLOWO2_12_FULL_42_16]OGQ73115.1 MAG: hypothetical protein A2235_00785 [Deltaproteobacteria bacterium RIFOXYA2_FULL_42_10]